ncbi:MAG: cytidylyltransferase domain-containing protein, partial [Planctomycetota bacterium]
MFRDQRVLAVVPARGGSKGIPRKNLQPVAGRSLVAHAAETLSALDWVDAAILSTDDEEIATEGRRAGLDVPFLRPDALAADNATAVDAWRHAWTSAEEHYGAQFDIGLWLEPTSPLRRPEDLVRTVETLLADPSHKAAATVSRSPAHYTPHKTLTIGEDGCIGFYLPRGADFSQRQLIPPY